MNLKHILGFVLVLQFATINVLAIINEYVYEFGNKDVGEEIFTKEGSIFPILSYNNYITIPLAPNKEITYVSVRVTAANPPKVDFDKQTRTVGIKFAFLQLTYSKYKIFVKGVSTGEKVHKSFEI